MEEKLNIILNMVMHTLNCKCEVTDSDIDEWNITNIDFDIISNFLNQNNITSEFKNNKYIWKYNAK